MIILLGVTLLFLPRLVSSQWFKDRLEREILQTFHRSVRVEQLEWTWSRGVRLEGLRVADDPAFSKDPLLSMERAILTIDLKELQRRRLVLGLSLEGVDLRLIRNPGGKTNLEALLSRFEGPKLSGPEPEKGEGSPFPLPLPLDDVQVSLQVKGLEVQVEDRSRDRRVAVHGKTLHLDIPSLFHKPITLSIDLEEEVDGKPLPPFQISARIENLFDSEARLQPFEAAVKINGSFPGGRIEVLGPGGGTVEGNAQLDLASFTRMVSPYLPTPWPDVSGHVEFQGKVSRGPGEVLTFALTLIGRDLSVTGGILKKAQIGPFYVKAFHEGTFHIPTGVLNVKKGEVHLQKNSRLTWRGTLNQLTGKSGPVADLTLGPVSFDLEELFPLVEGFIPSGISFQPRSRAKGNTPHPASEKGIREKGRFPFKLTAEKIRFQGPLPSGPNPVAFEGLTLNLPFIGMETAAGTVRGADVAFRVLKGDALLVSSFPSRVRVTAGLHLNNLYLKGAEVVKIDRLEIPSLEVVARSIALSPEALFGVTGTITLKESGTMGGVEAPYQVKAARLRQSVEAKWTLGPGPSTTVEVKTARLSSPSIQFEAFPGVVVKTPVDLEVSAIGLRLAGLDPLQVEVEKVQARIDARDLFKGSVEAFTRDLGKERLDTRGQITFNGKNLLSLLPSNRRRGVNLVGGVDIRWESSGRLPEPGEIDRLTNEALPLIERLRGTGFLKRLQLLVRLEEVGLELPLSEGSRLKVSKVRTLSPLKLVLKNGLTQGDFEGKVFLGRIEEVPKFGKLPQPVEITLSFSGSQENLKTLQVREEMHLSPFKVKQSAEISLNKIEGLLGQGFQSPLQALLKEVEGTALIKIRADLDADLSPYVGGLFLKGPLEAETEVRLTGGKEIKIKSLLRSSGLNVRLGTGFQVTRLQSHLSVEKSYRLSGLAIGSKGKEKSSRPLSVEVLSPEGSPQSVGDSRESVFRRFMGDLRASQSQQRNLSFEKALIKLGPLAVEVSNLEMVLRMVEALPHIDYFQMDVMGGTLAGSVDLISGPKNTFTLEVDCSFSGLNANKILPDVAEKASGEEAEISGRIFLRLPLSTDPDRVFRDLQARLDLTHIGSKALERFLYAIDPFESNETIVQQRNLLRLGSPRWIQLRIRHGNLFLAGEVVVKGIRVSLPKIDRLNVSNLPLHQKFEESLSRLAPILDLLKIISAEGIRLGPKGEVLFVSSD